MLHDDKKGLKYLLEMKNERSKPFPMAKANAFFSRYNIAAADDAASLVRNQATKSEHRKDEEISICIIIYLAFEQWTSVGLATVTRKTKGVGQPYLRS